MLTLAGFKMLANCAKSKKGGSSAHVIPNKSNTNSVAFSPDASYADRAAAARLAKLVPNLIVEGCYVVSATDPHDR
jgi:hypothetical protein